MFSKIFLTISHILHHARFQFFQRIKSCLRSLKFQEPDRNVLPICISCIIINVNFKQFSLFLHYRRLDSCISHTTIPCSVNQNLAGINSVPRKNLPILWCNIHRWESQSTPQFPSMFYNSRHLIRISKKFLCQPDISMGQSLPYIGAADLAVSQTCFFYHINSIIIFLCISLQHGAFHPVCH